MADNWFKLNSIDRNIDWLNQISEIANTNNLNITTQEVDLNKYYITEKYDCIFSTVVLQFLEKQSAINIIKSMQISTNVWWYNLIIIPIDSDDHLCPIRFPGLLKQWEIIDYYNNWEILEYNEILWTFHRKDELWNKIISRFATIIAKKS
jgi:tellurite methyltransferase